MAATITRVEIVQAKLIEFLASARPAPSKLSETSILETGTSLTTETAKKIFEDQITSRLLDVAARELKKRNLGFYTISSAGHEQNAVIGTLLRIDDPCFLHYRSGAFMMARSRKLPDSNAILDTLLSGYHPKPAPVPRIFRRQPDSPSRSGRHAGSACVQT